MKTFLTLCCILFLTVSASAQETGGAEVISLDDRLNYLVLWSSVALFGFLVLRAFYVANVALRQNGGELKFRFPMIRQMAGSSRSVGIIMVLIVLSAIIWAVCYQS